MVAEQFDSLLDVRQRLQQIVKELHDERLAGWKKGPADFHLRRLAVFCELLYTDLIARTDPELVRVAEEAVRMREQEDVGKREPPYSPPSTDKKFYEPLLERERDLVAELEAQARKKK